MVAAGRTILWAILLLTLSLYPSGAGAQDANNPFEIIERLPESARLTSNEARLSNPFDVVPHKKPGVVQVLAENETEPFTPFSLIPHGGGMSQATIFWVLLVLAGYLAFSIAANRSAVSKAWLSFLSENGLNVMQRETFGLTGNAPYYFLYGSFVLNAGLFIFLVVRAFTGEAYNNLLFLLMCMFGAGIAFVSKHFMIKATGWLFPVTKETQRYNFLMIVFNCILGLFLMPFNFLLAFSNPSFRFFLVFWTLGLVGIFYIYRAVRSAGIGVKFLGTDQFHFLLYLCVVEIAPVLLVIKWATLQV